MNHTTLHQAASSAAPTDHIAEELRPTNTCAMCEDWRRGRVVDFSKLRPDDVRRFTANQLEV